MSERISDERLAELITDAATWIARGYMDEQHLCALRELAELREQVRWRPMEEAPKDGSHVLLYRPHIRFVGYHSDAGWCINAPGLPLMQPEPTGWMPLPEIGPLPGGDA